MSLSATGFLRYLLGHLKEVTALFFGIRRTHVPTIIRAGVGSGAAPSLVRQFRLHIVESAWGALIEKKLFIIKITNKHKRLVVKA